MKHPSFCKKGRRLPEISRKPTEFTSNSPTPYRYVATQYPHERQSIMNALTYVKHPEQITEVLNFIFSDGVRPQDVASFVVSMVNRPHNILPTWKRFQLEWDWISTHLPPSLNGNILRSFGKVFTTPELRDELRNFFQTHPSEQSSAAISWSLDYANANVAYMAANSKTVRNWLKAHHLN